MLPQLRTSSPWGAKVSVSKPNQLMPVRLTVLPSASTSFEPTAWSGVTAAALATTGGCASGLTAPATRTATTATTSGTAMHATRTGVVELRYLEPTQRYLGPSHRYPEPSRRDAEPSHRS